MEAVYYKNGIAIFGNTQPWKEQLKQLGGRYNPHLEGPGGFEDQKRPGWVFNKNLEPQLLNFIAQANSGAIPQPATQSYQNYQRPQQQPQIISPYQTPVALSPRSAINRLNISQPNMSPQTIGRSSVLPQINPLITGNRPLSPSQRPLSPSRSIQPLAVLPTTVLQSVPQKLNFPNLYTAADGLTYQIIIYTVPLPTVGQRILLNVNGSNFEYNVTQVKESAPFDEMIITQVSNPEIEQPTEPQISQAVIINGQWKINGMPDPHTITFSSD